MPYANAPAPAAYPPFDQTPGRGFAEPAVVTPRPDKVVSEKQAASIPGLLGLLGALVVFFLGVFLATLNPIGVALIVIAALFGTSLTTIQPGDTKVLQFLGNYVGTVRETGLRMTMPFTTKRRVSVKVNNFETREIKVNDADGNPINIAAIVVWQVSDTAEAIFSVENYQQFVTVQSEAALRHIAMSHPYDNSKEGEATLRGATDQIAAELAAEVQARVAIAGIKVIETRISSLAYAPEIAQAMLQRQQAEAVLVARSRIVEGAVTMVESALERLEKDDIVQFDEERKAQMVSNLLVVLCGDSRATPTVPLN
jgi:regulator of protease activity HflC (stomatin/prohibitin superfamily)